ncbi:MAG: hypothetical protein IH971_02555 [Candidatus Marinimicrobia bacterium]|nr:hypothetical protein [Candidatus Neomarinimicrobiota bacterium]
MDGDEAEKVWIVVNVWRGMAIEVEAFDKIEAAWERQAKWREGMDPICDEAVVFEADIQSKQALLK